MKFEVYCDETLPDLFTSQHPQARYLMIGSLWLPADLRETVKARIAELRERHGVYGEMKWRKVSPSKLGFYTDLVDLFMSFGLDLRFRYAEGALAPRGGGTPRPWWRIGVAAGVSLAFSAAVFGDDDEPQASPFRP